MWFNFSKARLSIFYLNQCYTLILMFLTWKFVGYRLKATKAKSIKHTLRPNFILSITHFKHLHNHLIFEKILVNKKIFSNRARGSTEPKKSKFMSLWVTCPKYGSFLYCCCQTEILGWSRSVLFYFSLWITFILHLNLSPH